MNKFEKYTLVGVVSLCLLILLGTIAVWGAENHQGMPKEYHWWEYHCCNDKDCSAAPDGAVEQTKDGYNVHLPGGRIISLAWGDYRIRKKPADNPYAYDGLDHWCLFRGETGEVHVRCIYPRMQAY